MTSNFRFWYFIELCKATKNNYFPIINPFVWWAITWRYGLPINGAIVNWNLHGLCWTDSANMRNSNFEKKFTQHVTYRRIARCSFDAISNMRKKNTFSWAKTLKRGRRGTKLKFVVIVIYCSPFSLLLNENVQTV